MRGTAFDFRHAVESDDADEYGPGAIEAFFRRSADVARPGTVS
jgi:hypothetical protein